MKRTPFDALLQLRERRRDDAVRELGRRMAETQAERAGVERLEARKAELTHAAERERTHEQARANAEETRAVDWQRLGAYEVGVRARLTLLAQDEAVATRRLQEARKLEARSQSGVNQRDAEVRVTEARRERADAEERARQERAHEEEAADARNTRRTRR